MGVLNARDNTREMCRPRPPISLSRRLHYMLVSQATPLNQKERGVWGHRVLRVVLVECNHGRAQNSDLRIFSGQVRTVEIEPWRFAERVVLSKDTHAKTRRPLSGKDIILSKFVKFATSA